MVVAHGTGPWRTRQTRNRKDTPMPKDILTLEERNKINKLADEWYAGTSFAIEAILEKAYHAGKEAAKS